MRCLSIPILFATLLAGASSSFVELEPDVELVTWTKAGARFRARSATFTPKTVTVTTSLIFTPTATLQLRSMSGDAQIKRAFMGKWLYKGCVNDDESLPILVAPFSYQLDPDDVSSASCMHFCDNRGDTLVALGNGNECWCGKPTTHLNMVDNKSCALPCAASVGEKCGGSGHLSIYTKT